MKYHLTAKKAMDPALEEGRYYDTKLSGVYLRVGKRKRTFYLKYRCPVENKRKEYIIGEAQFFKRAELEAEVGRLKKDLARNIPPGSREKQQFSEGTLDKVTAEVLARMKDACKAQMDKGKTPTPLMSTIREYGKVANRGFGNLVEIPMERMTRADVSGWYHGLVRTGKLAAANKTLSVLKLMFVKADEYGLIEMDHFPTERIREVKYEPKGQDPLDEKTMRMLWKFTALYEGSRKNAIRFQLLTGCRMREVTKATWEQVDWDKGVWETETKVLKGDRKFVVPLSSLALVTLKDQMNHCKDSGDYDRNPYIFPGTASGSQYKITHFDNINKMLKGFCQEKEIPHFASHALRKTVATSMSEKLKVLPHVVEEVMGHLGRRIEKIYNKDRFFDEKKEALELWGRFISGEVRKASKNVVEFKIKA